MSNRTRGTLSSTVSRVGTRRWYTTQLFPSPLCPSWWLNVVTLDGHGAHTCVWCCSLLFSIITRIIRRGFWRTGSSDRKMKIFLTASASRWRCWSDFGWTTWKDQREQHREKKKSCWLHNMRHPKTKRAATILDSSKVEAHTCNIV